MKLACPLCQGQFKLETPNSLRVRCPHCSGEVLVADAKLSEAEAAANRGGLIRNSLSGLVSLVFHMALALILALIGFQAKTGIGEAEEVLIGELPSETLSDNLEDVLDADTEQAKAQQQTDASDALEVASPVATLSPSLDQPAMQVMSASGGDNVAFDLGTVTIGGGDGAGGSWEGLLQSLRRNGLDIVLAFDSTGSMGGEIAQVKMQIRRLGATLVKLVPKTRISVCTYRDDRDVYDVLLQPLTDDISEISYYLSNIQAGGGGDEPEAVHKGLHSSIRKNQFRPRARKVVLLFGDAPPHDRHLQECLELASDFHQEQDGIVSTVTCRAAVALPSFKQIAKAGGGEAFLTTEQRQIVTQLMILVFGSRHRGKVMEAFELMSE